MEYISSRDNKMRVSWSQAVLQGISKDGGLFVPQLFPRLDDFQGMIGMDYKELAHRILEGYFPNIGFESLKAIIDKAYDNKFNRIELAPVVRVDDIFFLELFHGPTLAFKDMALSILPHLLRAAMDKEGIEKEVLILTATSGDTGKAALESFANVDGIKIMVFYPKDGVSHIQRMQMLTQEGNNTLVVGIKGNFDDAQGGVKDIFNDQDFVEKLYREGYILSSANSINIGRLIPQIIYYYHAYMTLIREKEIARGEKINIVVPTGNFGNILAAYYGKTMGLPINKLICASNENNVLYDFLKTGTYDKRRPLITTSSPSMDILVSSNLERLIYHLSGRNDKLIVDKMGDLKEKGIYRIEDLNTRDFYAGFSDEKEVKSSIAKVFKEKAYLMDPHTAVAYNVYREYKEKTKDATKTLIASTASPFKFGNTVALALGIDIAGRDEFIILKAIGDKVNEVIPRRIRDLKTKALVHRHNCSKDGMKSMIEEFLGR